MAELKPIPDTEKIEFKERFIERYSKLTDFAQFKKYSLSFLRRSIRINTLKISVEQLKSRIGREWILTKIPWCKEGFWVKHKAGRLDIGNTMEHMLGYYYVQEAASMIPPVVLAPKPGEIILDMCAAPGSKTTEIAALMKNKGLVIANDVESERLKALNINLQRCGVANAIITSMKGYWFKQGNFDKILLDAPCSGTGTIRKSLKTLKLWNPGMIKRISGLQKKLIAAAFNILKPNGLLVYSTCSLEPEENEGVIDFLLKKFNNAKLEQIKLKLKRSPAVLSFENKDYNKKVKKCLRLWPQDNDTEGFFVAKIRKLYK